MAEEKKKYGAFSSSVNPQALSLTVKGLIVGLIPVILIILNSLGIDGLVSDDLQGIADGIEALILTTGTTISMTMTLYGLIRKAIKKAKGE